MRRSEAALIVAVLFCLAGPAAGADEFPTKPIRFVTSAGPGGFNDLLARSVSEPLRQQLGQPVIVENRPGAAGLIAQRALTSAPADGYTILMAAGELTMMPYISKSFAGFDARRDVTPVAHFGSTWSVIMANPKAPYRTLAELISYAKANPERVRFGGQSSAFTLRAPIDLLQTAAGIKLTMVDYRESSQRVNDMLSGQIELIAMAIPASLPLRDRLTMLAQTGPASVRHPLIPDVPTTGELGFPSAALEIWFGVVAPPRTPEPVVAKLAGALENALKTSAVRDKLVNMGLDVNFMAPKPFAEYLAADQEKWRQTVPKLGLPMLD